MNYQQQSLAGKNGVELVVALYDGMVRFLYQAIRAIEANDVTARRVAIKRTLDILMHLQSRLKEAISCVRDVREAWHTFSQDPEVIRTLREQQGAGALRMPSPAVIAPVHEAVSSSWSA